MSSIPLLTSGVKPDPYKDHTVSVAGQRTLPRKIRQWTMTIKRSPFSMTMTTKCPCGYGWAVSQERQLDAHSPCPKCGSVM